MSNTDRTANLKVKLICGNELDIPPAYLMSTDPPEYVSCPHCGLVYSWAVLLKIALKDG